MFNKLKVNFGKITHNVQINLFKSYCCSFYSSHLWKFNSHGFDKICKSWNIAIRTLLQLPFNAHTWLLGPITKQNNIRTQLYIRNYRFLYYASRSSNVIVKQCIRNTKYEIVYFKNMIKNKWQKNDNNQNKVNMFMLIRRLQNSNN